MKKYLLEYVRENLKMITIFLLCIFIGIVLGIILYQFSNDNTKLELKNTVVQTLDISKQDNFDQINIMMNGITTNLILISLIYFSAIIIISPIIISLLNIVKGIAVGVYIPILYSIFGFYNGTLALLFLIIIPNIFYIPTYVFLSTNALNLHYVIIEHKRENKLGILIKNFVYVVISFSFIFLSVLIEQILSNNIIDIYKGM